MNITTTPEDRGRPALEFLSSCLIWVSKRRLRRLFGEGRVTVDGLKVPSGFVLGSGAVVCVAEDLLSKAGPGAHIQVAVLAEDECHLAVNKPPGHTVLPDRAGRGAEFFNGLVRHLNPAWPDGARFTRPHIVHRLDRDTSGVLLVAKTAGAGRELAGQFERRRTRKTYLALIEGVPPKTEFAVDLPLARRRGRVLEMAVDFRKGKPALTRFRVIRPFGRFCLVEASPETGRQHQIRVHAAAIGFPLAVDFLYGRREALTVAELRGVRSARGARLVLNRCPLHASSIEYRHPQTGERRRVEAPVPGDLQAVLEALESCA